MLLRFTLAGDLFAGAAMRFQESDIALMLAVGDILTGALLSMGLWTPVVAVLASVLQLGLLPATSGTIEIHLVRASIGLCIAMLGPGAWSIDARLFGPRRVEIRNLRND